MINTTEFELIDEPEDNEEELLPAVNQNIPNTTFSLEETFLQTGQLFGEIIARARNLPHPNQPFHQRTFNIIGITIHNVMMDLVTIMLPFLALTQMLELIGLGRVIAFIPEIIIAILIKKLHLRIHGIFQNAHDTEFVIATNTITANDRIFVISLIENFTLNLARESRSTWIDAADFNQAGYSYLMTSREHQLLHYFLNRETFVAMNPVHEINSENRMVLDGYAFDIIELLMYARTNMHAIYRNPHRAAEGKNPEFSCQAQQRMKDHAELRQFIFKLEKHLLLQIKKINPATIDALIIMLNKIKLISLNDNWEESRDVFLAHVDTLNKKQQERLYGFIIETPILYGDGYQRMRFDHALRGGQAECVFTMQVFLWQFVVTVRPSAQPLVPYLAHFRAADMLLRIIPPTQAAQTMTVNSARLHLQFLIQFLQERFALLNTLSFDTMPSPNLLWLESMPTAPFTRTSIQGIFGNRRRTPTELVEETNDQHSTPSILQFT